MSTPSLYVEAPKFGIHRVFELKKEGLYIESFRRNRGKSGSATIEFSRVVLPSIRIEGRSIEILKRSASILVLIAVVAMSVCAIFSGSVSPTWVWVGALVIALPFLNVLLQSLKKNEFEVFKDAQGTPLVIFRRNRESEAELDAFLAALKTAVQQRLAPNMPTTAESGDCASARIGNGALPQPQPPPLPQPRATDLLSAALAKRVTASARWLYWVAALSGINILLTHLGATWRFAIGLGVTELVYAVGLQLGSIGTAMGVFLTIIALGCLVVLGFFAAKQQAWAFILGIIALSLDTLLLIALTGTEFLVGIVFHVAAIVFLCLGFNALRKLKKHQAPDGA